MSRPEPARHPRSRGHTGSEEPTDAGVAADRGLHCLPGGRPMFKIDPEFKALIPPLKPDELTELELSIKAEGVRDRLVVWAEEDILLDGHHRYEIATRLKKPYDTKGLSFPNRDQAKAWLITNQFARRNLTPAERC